jgi:hypothetical protein
MGGTLAVIDKLLRTWFRPRRSNQNQPSWASPMIAARVELKIFLKKPFLNQTIVLSCDYGIYGNNDNQRLRQRIEDRSTLVRNSPVSPSKIAMNGLLVLFAADQDWAWAQYLVFRPVASVGSS